MLIRQKQYFSLQACMYVCMYVCMYEYMYVCMRIAATNLITEDLYWYSDRHVTKEGVASWLNSSQLYHHEHYKLISSVHSVTPKNKVYKCCLRCIGRRLVRNFSSSLRVEYWCRNNVTYCKITINVYTFVVNHYLLSLQCKQFFLFSQCN